MQYPQSSREPNGCLQTLIISKLIIGMLLIPLILILGTVTAVIGTFYALTVHPLLALLVILLCAGTLYGLARWEHHRVSREIPRDE
jgi:hypothetical protein